MTEVKDFDRRRRYKKYLAKDESFESQLLNPPTVAAINPVSDDIVEPLQPALDVVRDVRVTSSHRRSERTSSLAQKSPPLSPENIPTRINDSLDISESSRPSLAGGHFASISSSCDEDRIFAAGSAPSLVHPRAVSDTRGLHPVCFCFLYHLYANLMWKD